MRKEYRIRKNEEFGALMGEHHSSASSSFVVYRRNRQEAKARFGISVSKKLGGAVERNLIKRQLRMMITETVDFAQYPFDCVVIVRKGYLKQSYAGNKKDLEKLLKTGRIG